MRSVVAFCIALFMLPAFAGAPSGGACYDLYAGGATVEPDFGQAYRCFAADTNWLMMALMQARGEGVPKDLEGAKSTLLEWGNRGGPVSHPLLFPGERGSAGEVSPWDTIRPEDMMRILTVILYGHCPVGVKICAWGEADDRRRSEGEGAEIRLHVDVRYVADTLDSAKPLDYCLPFYEPLQARFRGPNFVNSICESELGRREDYARSRRLAKVMAGLSPKHQALLREVVDAHSGLVAAELDLLSLSVGPLDTTSVIYTAEDSERSLRAALDKNFSEALWLAIRERKLQSFQTAEFWAADEALAARLDSADEAFTVTLYETADLREGREGFEAVACTQPGLGGRNCSLTPCAKGALAARRLAWRSYRDAFVRLAVDVYGETPSGWNPSVSLRILLSRGYARFLGEP